MKICETCFTEGAEKSTKFSLHHFSNRTTLIARGYNNSLCTSTEAPCSLSCALPDTRGGGSGVVDCYGTFGCGSIWEELLTLVT